MMTPTRALEIYDAWVPGHEPPRLSEALTVLAGLARATVVQRQTMPAIASLRAEVTSGILEDGSDITVHVGGMDGTESVRLSAVLHEVDVLIQDLVRTRHDNTDLYGALNAAVQLPMRYAPARPPTPDITP